MLGQGALRQRPLAVFYPRILSSNTAHEFYELVEWLAHGKYLELTSIYYI